MQHLHFHQFLQEKLSESPNVSLSDAMASFHAQLPDYRLLDEELVRMQLYASIALPWEQLKKKLPKKISLETLDTEKWGNYKIVNQNPRHPVTKMDLRFFLRKLRNAISHNQVNMKVGEFVLFRDSDGVKIRYEWAELLKLLTALEALLHSTER